MKADIAINTFIELYGVPHWEKEGQSIDEIKKLWEKELNDYSEEQIKTACYKLFRFRKTMTFPTISQLMAMLYDEEKPTEKEETSKQRGEAVCPELDLYNLVNPSCSFGKFRFAFQQMTEDFRAFYPMFDKLSFSTGLAKSMQNNGWWESKILDYLPQTKDNTNKDSAFDYRESLTNCFERI